ncbi:hypothetical protein [Fictibacillus fluitans]|uniref:Uncharacterized protein n=1 Tax=Fictibacillus fluitans TaxID=3058422 RepID=A0ABT8HX04_9BACL|nr:hypothetical protein [Fictibacillus sp. NE201]MDN4525311.1 hypothetical protein [Fictibacillus sp. NE201]
MDASKIVSSDNPWLYLFVILFLACLAAVKEERKRQEAQRVKQEEAENQRRIEQEKQHQARQDKLDQMHQEYREEAKEREKALLIVIERSNDNLEKQGASLEKITVTQEMMQGGLEKLENRVDKLSDQFNTWDRYRERDFRTLKEEDFKRESSQQ